MRSHFLKKSARRLALVVITLLAGASLAGAAATYTVTSIADDGSTSTVPGTLRWAAAQANADPGSTIVFDPASMGGNSITVLAALPSFSQPVTIDGGKTVVIGAAATTYGIFYFNGAGCGGSVVKDIALIKSQYGIYVTQAVTITGCNLGTDWSETSGLGNTHGIYINGGAGSVIGAPGAANRNIIVGSSQNGIAFVSARQIKMQNNYIGVLSDGKTRLQNSFGVYAWGSGLWNSLIGGDITAGEGNVVSGNSSGGQIWLTGTSSGNTFCGNILGLGADQTTAVANSCGGLILDSGTSGNWVGLPLDGYYNVVAGGSGNDLCLIGSNRNIVQNNYIGINALGNTGIAEGSRGLYLSTNASGNLIGGRQQASYRERNYIAGYSYITVTLTGNGNTICGNFIGLDATGAISAKSGVSAHISIAGYGNLIGGPNDPGGDNWGNVIAGAGDQIQITTGDGNTVVGNYLGCNAAGTAAITGSNYGVSIYNFSSKNLVGGASALWRNVISGNARAGVYFYRANLNTVAGNYINTTPDGTALLATGGATCYGIDIENATGNLIGGQAAGAGNYICAAANGNGLYFNNSSGSGNTVAGNAIGLLPCGTPQSSRMTCGVVNYASAGNWIGLPTGGANNLITAAMIGILISGASTVNNGLFGNTLCGNSSRGITLSSSGNGGMYSPYIGTATSSSIGGTATANAYVEVFAAENNTVGSALQLLGYTTADGSGNWSITPSGYTTGDPVSALASDSNNNTSAFGLYAPPAATATATPTLTPTVTATFTSTPTATPTPSPTFSATATATITPTVTPTVTESPVLTATSTATPTVTETLMITATPTVTATSAMTDTPTATASPTRTATPTVTLTATTSPTRTATPTVTLTATASPALTATLTATASPALTATLTATCTQTQASTCTPTPAVTEAGTGTATATPAPAIMKESVAYPNPGRGYVHFAWQETRAQHAKIVVYNLVGENVCVIQTDQPGRGADWQTAGIAPGIYIYQIVLTVDGVDKSLPKSKLAIVR